MTAEVPAFDLQGQGPDAVLLLHGIGGGRAIWGDAAAGTARALAALGSRVAAMDFPGYGGSVGLGLPGLQSMVDAVVTLIAALAPRRVALVGHSMGGMVAQELMATRLPQGQYQCLPWAGHIANVEQPAAFNTAVANFLQQQGFGA